MKDQPTQQTQPTQHLDDDSIRRAWRKLRQHRAVAVDELDHVPPWIETCLMLVEERAAEEEISQP